MGKLKTTFELDGNNCFPSYEGKISIVGLHPKNRPYLSVQFSGSKGLIAHSWVKDKDLELLAVNILKAINSKFINNQSYPKTKRYSKN